MKISIVVPAFNEEKLLGETLVQIKSAVGALTRIGWETELIVCDNHSTDRTAEIARAAGATVVFEPVNQIARARNTGASAATGDWLVFVDADTWPDAGLFAEMADAVQSGDCFAGSAIFRWDKKTFSTRVWMPVLHLAFRWRRLFLGPFIFIERAVFQKTGGFNAEIFAGEDFELSGRMSRLARETGKRLVMLHRHPVVTSARRVPEYSALTPARVLYHVVFDPYCFITNREAARRWYDGRR